MTDSTDPVILVGAGIGGLFAALCLERLGIKSILLEKSDALTEVGAGIQIGANGSRLIHQLGLQEAIEEYASSPSAGQIMDGRSGRSICPYPLNNSSLKRYQLPYYQIHRGDLQRILIEAVEQRMPNCLQLGTELRVISQDAERVQVTTNSGERINGRALVGCDGIHSCTRELLFTDGTPRFTGNLAWRAVVPLSKLDQSQEWRTPRVWVGPGRHLVQYPVSAGNALNLVACVETDTAEPERWQGNSSVEELYKAFVGWCPEVQYILSQADDALKWGLYERPVLSNWSKGRATLLGDAAHAMLPSLAQGAVMAMEDAAELAQALNTHSNTVEALQKYEQSRITRCRKVQQVARDNLEFFHQSSGFKDRLSLRVLALMGQGAESVIANRYGWLYGYSGFPSEFEKGDSGTTPNSI
jgi:salicylate hydroxylase